MTDEERIEAVIADWREDRNHGRRVPPHDVIQVHPDLAADLRPVRNDRDHRWLDCHAQQLVYPGDKE